MGNKILASIVWTTLFTSSVSASILDDYSTDLSKLDTVYSPSKMLQSKKDVPGSVFVLTREQISSFGIRDIPEALAMASGMVVSERGNDTSVSYHGLNTVLGRRINILIDGVVVYDPAIARVPWRGLPVSIDEIERIEISKSPAAATYGSNSFLAVVNIFTENPELSLSKVVIERNSKGYSGLYRQNLKFSNTSINLSVGVDKDDRYDNDVTFNKEFNGGVKNKRINWKSISEIDEKTTIKSVIQLSSFEENNTIAGTVVDSRTDVEPLIYNRYNGRISFEKQLDIHNLEASFGFFKGEQDHKFNVLCQPLLLLTPEFLNVFNASFDYAEAVALGQTPSGGGLEADIALAQLAARVAPLGPGVATAPVCGDTDVILDQERASLHISDEIRLNRSLRLKLGLGFKEDKSNSRFFFNNMAQKSSTINSQMSVEYRPSKKLTFNFGAYAEDSDIVSDPIFAPRIGANFHVNSNVTLKAAYTRSYRTPDLFEQYAHWTLHIDNIETNPLGVTSSDLVFNNKAPGNLNPEKIDSYEIGMLYNNIQNGLSIDTKVFRNHLSDLIDSYLNIYTFDPTNNGKITLSGIETDLKYVMSRKWMLLSGLSYLDRKNATTEERATFKRLSGSFSLARLLGAWTISGRYQGAKNTDSSGSQNLYDLTVMYRKNPGIEVSAYYSYDPSPNVSYLDIVGFPLPGWRDASRLTVSNDSKYRVGMKLSYEW